MQGIGDAQLVFYVINLFLVSLNLKYLLFTIALLR